jgi:transcriptional regulator with XRE-family HTH domain
MPRPSFPLARVGRRIKAARKQLGMTRAAFAQASKVSEVSLARLEQGRDVRASTYLAVVGYLQRRHSSTALAERIARLSEPERAQVVELVRRLESLP